MNNIELVGNSWAQLRQVGQGHSVIGIHTVWVFKMVGPHLNLNHHQQKKKREIVSTDEN